MSHRLHLQCVSIAFRYAIARSTLNTFLWLDITISSDCHTEKSFIKAITFVILLTTKEI